MTAAVVGVFLAWSAVAQAGIQTLNSSSSDIGAINGVKSDWSCQGSDTYNVNIQGTQFWGPGQMVMDFTTDASPDPTLKPSTAVFNDSGVAWIGYALNVTLDVPSALTSFSLSNVGVTNPDDDWTAKLTQPLAFTGIKETPYGTQYEYVASIGLEGETPIAGDGGDDSELDYTYKLTFQGPTSSSYHATEEGTPFGMAGPVLAPAPEPGTLILALSGLLGWAALRVARRRRA